MQIEISTLIVLAFPCITGLVWLIRLEGRVNLTESRFADLKNDLNEMKSDLKKLVRHGDRS